MAIFPKSKCTLTRRHGSQSSAPDPECEIYRPGIAYPNQRPFTGSEPCDIAMHSIDSVPDSTIRAITHRWAAPSYRATGSMPSDFLQASLMLSLTPATLLVLTLIAHWSAIDRKSTRLNS